MSRTGDALTLDAATIKAFQSDGHVLVRGVATSAEVESFRPIIRAAMGDAATRPASSQRIDNYATYFEQVTNVWRVSDAAREVVFSSCFASIAAQLLGADAVRLYHDQALFKPAGAPRTPWHRDSYYWPLDPSRALTMWLPLVDVELEMGPIVFATGSHHDAEAGAEPISEDGGRRMAHLIAEKRWPVATQSVWRGDATFHAAGTVHGSAPNRSPRTREVLTVIYYADGIVVNAPANPHQEVDLRTFLPGVLPGEPAVSELNPVLHSQRGPDRQRRV